MKGFLGWKSTLDSLRGRRGESILALRDVSFEVSEGEWFGILGPNGAGKTSFVDILADILIPTSGRVLFDGKDINRDRQHIAGKICFFDKWDMENRVKVRVILRKAAAEWAVPAERAKSRIAELAPLLGIEDKLDEWILRLSAGMKSKVRLLATLLCEPEILVFDEATLGLDVPSRRRLYDELNAYRAGTGCTIIWTTHNLHEAEAVCDRVALLNNSLITVDKPAEIVKRTKDPNLEEAFMSLLEAETVE